MELRPRTLTVRAFLPAAALLILLGWTGLFAITNFSEPSGGTRWAFFFFAVLGLTGLALPAVAFLNKRFPSNPPPTHAVILRQAVWVGIYLPTLAWLRIGRVLNVSIAILIIAGLILIEWLLRLRERSQWKPE
ncbi:MAG: hypothetical protein B6D39_07365 [Anaerolineae bacterium UTCFX2]|jgi:hypothetical protein|nr:hypothetical protein [Anaerolineales bacterium]OQY90967.1 MAG: hypothetical protein B6D39_07365 [Anaerolineae bacterium UTCFX2]